MGLKADTVQAVFGTMARAVWFEIGSAISLHARPMHGATDRPGEGMEGVAQAQLKFLPDFQPVLRGEADHLGRFV